MNNPNNTFEAIGVVIVIALNVVAPNSEIVKWINVIWAVPLAFVLFVSFVIGPLFPALVLLACA
jgi:hypothetical protein